MNDNVPPSAALRVLIFIPRGMMGGAERIAYNFASALLEAGHQVDVVILYGGEGSFWPDLVPHSGFRLFAGSARSEARGLLDFLRCLIRLRHEQYDLVYSTHSHMNALASLTVGLKIVRARRLVSRETTLVFDRFVGRQRWLFRLYYLFYRRQDLLIFQTEEMRQSLFRRITLPRRITCMVLPNPIDIAKIDRSLKGANSVELTSGQERRIVYCGRLVPVKQIDVLLEALALIGPTGWRLDILGEGPLGSFLEDRAKTLGLSERVRFVGHVANPCQWFADADLGVLCSKVEGFPNVLLEMMASGTRHVVTTACTNSVRHLPGVEIVERDDAATLAAAISAAITNGPDHRATYRSYVEQERSVSSFMDAIFSQVGLNWNPAL